MQNQCYWGRAMRHLSNKYLGFDWRILPLAGTLGSIALAIFLHIPAWAKVLLGYPVFIILLICYALSAYDIWREDILKLKPIEQLVNSRKDNMINFVFPYISKVNAYKLFREIDNTVILTIHFPSLLLEDKELKLKLKLFINNNDCLPVSIGNVKLFRDAIASISLEYPITERKAIINMIKASISGHTPISVILEIWDEDNERIRWTTSEWSTLPLS